MKKRNQQKCSEQINVFGILKEKNDKMHAYINRKSMKLFYVNGMSEERIFTCPTSKRPKNLLNY